MLIVFIASVALVAYGAFRSDLVWTLVGLACMFGSLICFALGNRGHHRKRLPFEVRRDGEWYFYYFHGGYGYEWARANGTS